MLVTSVYKRLASMIAFKRDQSTAGMAWMCCHLCFSLQMSFIIIMRERHGQLLGMLSGALRPLTSQSMNRTYPFTRYLVCNLLCCLFSPIYILLNKQKSFLFLVKCSNPPKVSSHPTFVTNITRPIGIQQQRKDTTKVTKVTVTKLKYIEHN